MNPANKTILCKACDMHDHTDNCDLSPEKHLGFTVGKRGKIMYWYFTWHGGSTGNASIFTAENPMRRAYIKGDQLIKIHFKNQSSGT